MTSPSFLRITGSLAAFAFASALCACGGRVPDVGAADDAASIDSTARDSCAPLPCPSGAPWSATKCACETADDGGLPPPVDATVSCAPLACPEGSVKALVGTLCACLFLSRPDAGGPAQDASMVAPEDASNIPPEDAAAPTYDASYGDVWYSPQDAGSVYLADASPPYDGSYCYWYTCGQGYMVGPGCGCVPCANTCPSGQTPGQNCNGCVACASRCPQGFDDGPSCSCVPHGVDAGSMPSPDAGDGGGVTCSLGAYATCAAGSWCQLGTCPDGTTQYGCYCNADGTSTCSLTCPPSPSCIIPGQAACAPGRQCVYGSCAGNPSAELLVCSCSSYMSFGDAGSASCYTASCADGGPYLPDAGNQEDGGVTCNLEGYITCSAGSWCPLGTCQDGTTQYGCFCHQDGTATCNLACPRPPPCQIPGEGTCPAGSSCVFGCSSGAGTGLSCYCYSGANASCNTVSCAQITPLPMDGGGD